MSNALSATSPRLAPVVGRAVPLGCAAGVVGVVGVLLVELPAGGLAWATLLVLVVALGLEGEPLLDAAGAEAVLWVGDFCCGVDCDFCVTVVLLAGVVVWSV
jgi:hypothetical protein